MIIINYAFTLEFAIDLEVGSWLDGLTYYRLWLNIEIIESVSTRGYSL
jgi:hypothetical protein